MQWNKINLQHQQGLWGLQGQTLKTPKQSILYLQQFVLKPFILSITECPGVLFWFSGLLVTRNFAQRAENRMCSILKLQTFFFLHLYEMKCWLISLSQRKQRVNTNGMLLKLARRLVQCDLAAAEWEAKWRWQSFCQIPDVFRPCQDKQGSPR